MIELEEICKNFYIKRGYIEPYSELAETMSNVLKSSIKSYFKESEANTYTKRDYLI